MNCVFCDIASGAAEAVILWEDSELVMFLDRCPVREGHAHVIPRAHFETFDVLSPALAGRIVAVGQEHARRLKQSYGVDRVAFLFTGGDVPHVHAHVIPMHSKTDITSARYLVAPADAHWSSAHLRATMEDLRLVRERLGYGGGTL